MQTHDIKGVVLATVDRLPPAEQVAFWDRALSDVLPKGVKVQVLRTIERQVAA